MTSVFENDPHDIADKLEIAAGFIWHRGSSHYAGVCSVAARMIRELRAENERLRQEIK